MLVEHAHPWGDEDLEGMDIAWNPAGTCVAYSLRTAVEIWDPEQDAIVRRLIGNVDQVKSLSWDPDGSHLLTSDTSHRIKIWNVATPNSSPTIETEGPLQSLTWGDSESLALDAVTADDLSNSRWNVTESLRVSGPTSVVSRQGKRVLSPDRRWVANWANPTDESSVVVYDARNGDIAAVLTPQPPFKPLGTGDAVSWSPDGAKLSVAICTETESGLEVWDVRSEKRVARWTRIPARSATWADVNFRRLTWSPDGKWVAAIGRGEDADSGTYKWSGRVHVVDAQTGIRVAKLAAGTEGRDNLSTFAWSPDSRSVAMATPEGAITITEVGTGRQVGRCKPHDLSISALVWSPDGQRLASSSIDGSISIVAPQGGRELLQLTPRSGAANLLAWSPDGHALAAASENAIEVWDATSGYAFAPGNAREPELAWVYSELASESSVEMQTALEQLIKLAPRRLDYCVLRSDSCAQLLRYEQAAKELNSVVTPNLEETWQLAYFQLFAYLGSGELEAYDELLGQMDKEIWKSADEIPWTDRDIYFRLRSLWLNSFVPQTSGDFKLRLDQFNRYLQGADPGQQEIGKRYLGPLLYRLGRYEEAAEMLKSMALELADALTADDKHRFAVQRIFWAMARHRLGHHYQAKRLLAESLPACYMLERDPLEHWTRAVALKTLRMEAESLLGVQEATSETSDLNE